MKQISQELAERLAGEVTRLCLCWDLLRKDGASLRLTDHDRPIVVDGETYEPGGALEAGTFTQTSDLKPGQGGAGGLLSSESITETDLLAGLWNGARVSLMRVDWERPDLGAIPVWTGFLSEITYGDNGAFEAELVSLKAELEKPIGQIVKRRCSAVLGDSLCGVSVQTGQTCDQRFETCRDVFANTMNFRGFPHLPGTDFVLSGPAASGNDGGKR